MFEYTIDIQLFISDDVKLKKITNAEDISVSLKIYALITNPEVYSFLILICLCLTRYVQL